MSCLCSVSVFIVRPSVSNTPLRSSCSCVRCTPTGRPRNVEGVYVGEKIPCRDSSENDCNIIPYRIPWAIPGRYEEGLVIARGADNRTLATRKSTWKRTSSGIEADGSTLTSSSGDRVGELGVLWRSAAPGVVGAAEEFRVQGAAQPAGCLRLCEQRVRSAPGLPKCFRFHEEDAASSCIEVLVGVWPDLAARPRVARTHKALCGAHRG